MFVNRFFNGSSIIIDISDFGASLFKKFKFRDSKNL